MTTFTLISYTQGEYGWTDRCGDYHDGSPSELDIDYFVDPKECGFMWAYKEREYETIKLLIDGIDPEYTGEYELINQAWEEADKYREEQSAVLKAERDKREAERIAREEAAREAEASRRRAEVERKEREQLAALQKKYGGK